MAIAVVQSAAVLNPGSGAGSFASSTTTGNCVVVLVFTYNGSNVTVSTSAATLGGSADNFSQAAHVQSGYSGSDTQFLSAWVDPDCAGGKTAIAVTASNATWINGAGMVLYELSGVATSSAVDVTSTSSGTTGTAMTSGTTAATGTANEMAVGAVYPDNGMTAYSGTYTNVHLGTSLASAGTLALPSSGSTTAYTGTGVTGAWAGLVITLKPRTAAVSGSGLLVSALFP